MTDADRFDEVSVNLAETIGRLLALTESTLKGVQTFRSAIPRDLRAKLAADMRKTAEALEAKP